ncbi:MAG: ABC transporter permease [Alphaproteobacteria bacterium]|nr:ABC transporter permease [Alphaproteobacteria bacterium]TAD88765.1 MAG: ABC transporter permease [Alphaproteobacteria bacterium]
MSLAGQVAHLVLRRLVQLIWVLPATALAAFLLLALSPIDPIDAYIDQAVARLGEEQRALIAARWGFDQPVWQQALTWLGRIATGDFGWSSVFNAPVAAVIVERAGTSLSLMAGAFVVSGLIGFSLGLAAGTYPGSWLDRAIVFYALTLASAPTFWIALVLIAVVGVELGWAPTCCALPLGVLREEATLADRLSHLALPMVTLAVLGVAQVTLHTRARQVEVMESDYARLSLAHGDPRWRVGLTHGVKNAALPAIVLHAAHLGELFGGSILAEQAFAYPGLGQATVLAGLRGDAPLLLAIALVAVLLVFLGNLIADVLHRLIDPRYQEMGHQEREGA